MNIADFCVLLCVKGRIEVIGLSNNAIGACTGLDLAHEVIGSLDKFVERPFTGGGAVEHVEPATVTACHIRMEQLYKEQLTGQGYDGQYFKLHVDRHLSELVGRQTHLTLIFPGSNLVGASAQAPKAPLPALIAAQLHAMHVPELKVH